MKQIYNPIILPSKIMLGLEDISNPENVLSTSKLVSYHYSKNGSLAVQTKNSVYETNFENACYMDSFKNSLVDMCIPEVNKT